MKTEYRTTEQVEKDINEDIEYRSTLSLTVKQSKSLSVFKSNLHSIDLTKFLKGRIFNLS